MRAPEHRQPLGGQGDSPGDRNPDTDRAGVLPMAQPLQGPRLPWGHWGCVLNWGHWELSFCGGDTEWEPSFCTGATGS